MKFNVVFMSAVWMSIHVSTALASMPCISWQQALEQSQSFPQTVKESSLPVLGAGWAWEKNYETDLNHTDSWSWLSWPDGNRLSVCENNFSAPLSPATSCSAEKGPYTVFCGGTCRFTNGYIATQTCTATYSDGNECLITQNCEL